MKILIKIGTQALLNSQGELNEPLLQNITTQIAQLKAKGIQIILVSSGAVGCGRWMTSQFKTSNYQDTSLDRQILASIGQHELMRIYSTYFKQHKLVVSQILLTKEDFRTRSHYLNIAKLLQQIITDPNIIPIINENDSVAIQELMFTDNDELAGLISAQQGVEKCIILTNVAGVYDKDPNLMDAKLLEIINPQDKWHAVSITKSRHGRGGMYSKLSIAKKLSALGITTYIASIHQDDVIIKLANGVNVGTMILPFKKKSSIKRWLAFSVKEVDNRIYINECLYELLLKNKVISIMPVGITKCIGNFEKGDLVEIYGPDNINIGVGIAKYNIHKLKEYMGNQNTPLFIHYNHLYTTI